MKLGTLLDREPLFSAAVTALRGYLRLPPSLLRRIVGPAQRSPEGYELDLQTQALLLAMRIEPELHASGVERSRERMDRNAPVLDRGASGVAARDLSAGGVPIRVYTPFGRGPLPVIVYFHGGGWVIGSIRSHDGACRALANGVGALVISVGYRLAPEHRYPAAIEDALAATRFVQANAAEWGGDPSRVAVAGDSAGGYLAAWTALRVPGLAFQLLLYPAAELLRTFPSHSYFSDGYLLTKASMDWFLERYVDEPDKQAASPYYVDELTGPPAMVMTAGFDPLRDEGRAYARRLREAGIPVDDRLYPGLIHGFFNMGGAIDAASAAFDDAVVALRRAFRTPQQAAVG